MGEIEGRYLGVEYGDDGSSIDEDEEGLDEGLEGNSEWYEWTSNIVFLAEKLNRDVDQITKMPYVTFLFWNNYFKLRQEEEFRNNRTR